MLNVIILILALVVATIFGVYHRRVNQQKKASQAIMKKRLAHVERIKNGFDADLQRLSKLGILSEQAQEAIFRLASYYFVFQPANSESLEQFEIVLKNLLMAIRNKLQDSGNNNPVYLRLQLDDFANSLPRKAAGYNASFYRNDLPVLIQQFVEAQGITGQEEGSFGNRF